MIRLFEVHGIIWVFCEMRSNIFDKYVHPLKQNDYFQKKKKLGKNEIIIEKSGTDDYFTTVSKGI
jgi:predicted transcriptional regulator